jgi:hypothetical protein
MPKPPESTTPASGTQETATAKLAAQAGPAAGHEAINELQLETG